MLSEQTAPEQTNTESVVWAASRIEIELYLFLDAIGTFAEDDSSMTREDLRGRFVALRDQFASLRGGSAAEALRTSPNFAAIAETVADGIDRIDVALASLRKDDKPAITRLKEQAMRLAQPMHTLSVQALQLDTSASEFRYKRVQRVYIELVGFFIGILVSGGVLVFLLFRGVRRAQRLLTNVRSPMSGCATASSGFVISPLPLRIGCGTPMRACGSRIFPRAISNALA